MTSLVLNNWAKEYSYLNISCMNSVFFFVFFLWGVGGRVQHVEKHSRSGWGRGVQLVK